MFLHLVSIISTIATGVFAAYGLVHDYKDKKGRLTRHGRIALYGILGMTTLGLLSVIAGIRSASQEAKQIERDRMDLERKNTELISRTTTILEGVQDDLTSFEDGTIFASLTRPLVGPILKQLRSELNEIVALRKEGLSGVDFKGVHFYVEASPRSTGLTVSWEGDMSSLTMCTECFKPFPPAFEVFPAGTSISNAIESDFDNSRFELVFGGPFATCKYEYKYSTGDNTLRIRMRIEFRPVWGSVMITPSLRSLMGRCLALEYTSIGNDWELESLRIGTRSGMSLSATCMSAAISGKLNEIVLVVQMSSQLDHPMMKEPGIRIDP